MTRLASRSLFRSILVPVALVAFMAQSASSSSVTLSLSNFNLMTPGGYASNSDIQGAVLIGGTVGSNLNFGGQLNGASTTATDIVNNLGSGSISANATVAGNVGTGVGNFTASSSPPSSFTKDSGTVNNYINALGGGSTGYASYLGTTSTNYANLATNSTVASTLVGNNLDFKVTTTSYGGQNVAVFSVSQALLNSSTYQNGNVTLTDSMGNALTAAQVANDTIVINVTGTSFSLTNGLTFNNVVGLADTGKIIYNFESVTSINNFTNMGGSILGPNLILNTSSSVRGGIYVSSITSVGEIDMAQVNSASTTYGGFTGYVVPAVIPEPASVAMIVIGGGIVAGFTAVRRRRALKV